MSETVYLNGIFLSGKEAVISPNDRGFFFADGVYEVIKSYRGKLFRYDDHLERLERSLKEIRLTIPGLHDLKDIFLHLLEVNGLSQGEAGVYLQISRGNHPRVHHFPEGIEPTVYAFSFEFPSNREKLEDGIRVVTREDIRWLRCDIKSVCLLANSMMYDEAVREGAGECILVRDGLVTEATHSSVAGIKNGVLYTHPQNRLILPGITRKVILEICEKEGIPAHEQAIDAEQLYEYDELLIAGTGSEIMPVIAVDNRWIGSKKPGEITRLLQKKFFELV